MPKKATAKTKQPATNLAAAAAPSTAAKLRPQKLPNVLRLSKTALTVLGRHWGLFFGIVLIYGLLNLVLVQGIASSANLTNAKQTLDELLKGVNSPVLKGATLFVYLVGDSAGTAASGATSAYQLVLFIMVSLALIWGLRQVYAGTRVRIRDAYFQGMAPLVPFILVLCVIGLELVPIVVGGSLYATVIANNLAATFLEQALCFVLFACLALLSLFLLTMSMMSLYIVTLPNMTPVKALRSGRELVRGRQWSVLRKALFLPLVLLIVSAGILIPIILSLTAATTWVFFLVTMFSIAFTHSYLYTLYRSLLDDQS